MKKKKKRGIAWAFSMLLGFICALVLGALFYGAMVYQLGGDVQDTLTGQASVQAEERAGFSGRRLALAGELTGEDVRDVLVDDVICRVVTRTYRVGEGTATAVSASPAAYLTRLAQEGFVPQLITGFSLAGLDAVCEMKDGRRLLVAREGENVYLLEAQADEQTLYALGAGASLE